MWHNATGWLSNNGLDGVTNYPVSRAIFAFVCDSTHDIFKYRSTIDELIHSYTKKQLKTSMLLLDSHDTPRLRTIVHNDKDKIKFALLLLFTFYGTPSLYYGTERYMEGAGDLDNRSPTNWNDHSPDVEDIYQITKLLIQLRHDHHVLANDGELEWIDHNELLIMHRYNDTENHYTSLTAKNMI
ncbi:alpha-amylase family glycosyl hydrolase [Sharpea porci]|uniref:alpha-amylase family glycosyl hydrolase n=1 Tax=Sharpea porci TaxID=2652286 RepID=UPI002A916AEA|nr:alpha-amylase family glycosyl hydrolase [Sharpea porci]MDY5279489.1 alpha-amylase family glycosyl hydrolase [Sharpea porci]